MLEQKTSTREYGSDAEHQHFGELFVVTAGTKIPQGGHELLAQHLTLNLPKDETGGLHLGDHHLNNIVARLKGGDVF